MLGIVESFIDAVRPDERIAKRDEPKQQIKQRNSLLSEARILQSRADDLCREQDQAADRHTAATRPLQAELRTLSPTDDVRRLELMLAVEAENKKLDDVKEEKKRLKSSLLQRVSELRSEAAQYATAESKLASAPLANPQLLLEQHAASQAAEWAHRRHRAAADQVKAAQSHVDALNEKASGKATNTFTGRMATRGLDAHEREQLAIYQSRLARWTHELNEASAALTAAKAECDRIYREMIEE